MSVTGPVREKVTNSGFQFGKSRVCVPLSRSLDTPPSPGHSHAPTENWVGRDVGRPVASVQAPVPAQGSQLRISTWEGAFTCYGHSGRGDGRHRHCVQVACMQVCPFLRFP